MNLIDATKKIIKMYNLPYNPSSEQWHEAFRSFDEELEGCDDISILLACIFYDDNWYLPFDYRLRLMNKAKNLGANSYDFLADYYSYKIAFLDPGVELDETIRLLNELNQNCW